ncbi:MULTISPECIES: hypothetical protein [Lactobacillus]|uniref:hypothetical protein n=1 Tax=Lactobacillus TaxID=1578 RepID=UPI00248F5984|nr:MULTISPECIES: hypothetical protein [Lactobacillus]
MIIKIAMIIFIILLLLTAWYMWHLRSGQFLIYDVGSHPELAKALTWTSIALMCESVLGLIIVFFGNKYMNLITIALACLTILIFGLLFKQNN